MIFRQMRAGLDLRFERLGGWCVGKYPPLANPKSLEAILVDTQISDLGLQGLARNS